MVALGLADGDEQTGARHRRGDHLRAVPAGDADVPQLGKKQRGEPVSCFLLRIEDNMESIGALASTPRCSCPSAAAAWRCC